jgi:glucose/arabinose dehydrogenase
MKGPANTMIGSMAAFLLAIWVVACTSVQEQRKSAAPAVAQQPAPTKKEEPSKPEAAKTETKTAKKAVEVEGVISGVGQRTITFQLERKGKVREEVVGVDDKTNIEKGGSKVKIRDLQETDKALINYEPDAYTPALGIKVIGQGEIKKVGGDD